MEGEYALLCSEMSTKKNKTITSTNCPELSKAPYEIQQLLSADPLALAETKPSKLKSIIEFFHDERNDALHMKKIATCRELLAPVCSPQESNMLLDRISLYRARCRQYLVERYGLYDMVARDWIQYWRGDFQKAEMDTAIVNLVNSSYSNACPMIICDRLWRIVYVSSSYRTLTAWMKAVPTPAFSLFTEMSPAGFREFVYSAIGFVLTQLDQRTGTNWFMLNVSMRDYGNDCFIDGTLHVTAHFDQYGVPLVFTITFLPKLVPSPFYWNEAQQHHNIIV